MDECLITLRERPRGNLWGSSRLRQLCTLGIASLAGVHAATLIDLLRKSRARTFIRVVKRTLIAFVYDWEEHNQRRAKEFASANKIWPSTLQILCFSVNWASLLWSPQPRSADTRANRPFITLRHVLVCFLLCVFPGLWTRRSRRDELINEQIAFVCAKSAREGSERTKYRIVNIQQLTNGFVGQETQIVDDWERFFFPSISSLSRFRHMRRARK